MGTMRALKRAGVIIGFVAFLTSLNVYTLAVAQKKSEPTPCPTPYIKLIKPNLASVGQQVIIRGRRFGPEEKKGEVIFPPHVRGKIISWRNSRITAEIPPGAKTGKVVIKTRCGESNGEFFKVAE